APAESVLRLARARRRLETDPARAAGDLVELAAALPAAAQALIAAAGEAAGSERMPVFYAALERLLDERPEDLDVLFAAADYRALHFEEAGARDLYLAARDLAPDQASQAQALSRLPA